MHAKDSCSANNESDELSSRFTELEKTVVKLKEASSSSWQRWIEILSKLGLPLLLFWLAFTFKDSVQHALEYRRLEVQSAEAMEKLLQTLLTEEVDLGKTIAASLTLSAYGEVAIPPLVAALDAGSTNTEMAAQKGIFVIGLSHPEAVTRSLGAVLSKRKGQFRWQTHQAAIKLLGEIACPKGLDLLLSYKPLLEKVPTEGLAIWSQIVRDADKKSYEETQQTLRTALAVFGVNWAPFVAGGMK